MMIIRSERSNAMNGMGKLLSRRNFNNRDGIDCYSDSVFDDDGDMSEVIGNIHDNPELLEVSKND